ncbi:MAG: hypothetical protein DMF61_26235 [Blastocatellia bacterium AA13]|nr:MAG: hypothetical protein DMF61_26235 [Blastocatellia bacterium AA13]
MKSLSAEIILGFVVCLWFLLCVLTYRRFRSAAWLAGSSSASCLFFLGATIATSYMVLHAFFLLPLWIGVGLLLAMHLFSAQRTERSNFLADAPDLESEQRDFIDPSVMSGSEFDPYI